MTATNDETVDATGAEPCADADGGWETEPLEVEAAGQEVDASDPVDVAPPEIRRPWVRDAFPPLSDVITIGDAGRQAEVVPTCGPLSIGVSDTELDFFTAEPFEVRACSTRGASHRHSGVPRQDAFCVAANDDWVVACVADGVSQGKHSQVAAETAARATCKLVLDSPKVTDIDWGGLANRISRRIFDEARYRRLVDLDDSSDPAEQVRVVRQAMSTTAVVAALSRQADDDAFDVVVVVLAGDSGAYVVRDGAVTLLAGGKDVLAAVTDSSVHPLPGPVVPAVLTGQLRAGDGLILTTDGVGDPLGDGTGEVGLVLGQRWQRPPTAAQLFTDVNFLRRSYDDDRTVVGCWVLPEQVGGAA